MKKVLLLFLLLVLGGSIGLAQNTDQKAGFEMSLSENLLTGTHQLMNFASVNLGYVFSSNDKVLLDFSFGSNVTGYKNQSQVLSLMYGHEFRFSEKFGTQVAFGPGVLRDLDQEDVFTLKPIATFDIQHRIYFTQKSFVGFSAKAFVTKGYNQASFIGFLWGTKL